MLHPQSRRHLQHHSLFDSFSFKALGLVPSALGLVPFILEPVLFNLLLLISILFFQYMSGVSLISSI